MSRRPEDNEAWRRYEELRQEQASPLPRPQHEPREAPREPSQRLVTLPRRPFGDKPAAELRLDLETLNGNRFATLSLWQLGPRGYHPTTKPITIRRTEIAEVLRGLTVAARELGVALDGTEVRDGR